MTIPTLTRKESQLIESVFCRHPEIREVRLFGSRAKGTHHAGSDVDLALWGALDALEAQAIASELDELPLPYKFDVQAFAGITFQPLREHVERVGILVHHTG